MPTVRCPSCQRALNLPERLDVQTARCPMCQAVFDVPSGSSPPPPVSAWSAPNAPPPARDEPVPRAPRDLEVSPEARDARNGADALVRQASGWLKAMVALGLVQVLSCGLCGCVRSMDTLPPGGWLSLPAVLLALRLGALLLVYSGAEQLRRPASAGLSRAGAITALVYAGLTMLQALPALGYLAQNLRMLTVGPGVFGLQYLLSVALTYATGACGVIGGLLALTALARRDAADRMRR